MHAILLHNYFSLQIPIGRGVMRPRQCSRVVTRTANIRGFHLSAFPTAATRVARKKSRRLCKRHVTRHYTQYFSPFPNEAITQKSFFVMWFCGLLSFGL